MPCSSEPSPPVRPWFGRSPINPMAGGSDASWIRSDTIGKSGNPCPATTVEFQMKKYLRTLLLLAAALHTTVGIHAQPTTVPAIPAASAASGTFPAQAALTNRGSGGFGASNTVASAQDRQKMMNLLGITSLRPGRNGSNPQATNHANYDEARANPFPRLPDPLVMKNGQKVTTAALWWNQRRPEIVEDFDREIYGRVPKTLPAVKWEVTGTTKTNHGDVPVITKQLLGRVGNSSHPEITVNIQASLTTPANAKGPVPVMMQFGFLGGFGGFRGTNAASGTNRFPFGGFDG